MILFAVLAAVLLTSVPTPASATDANPHHTPTPTATPQPPTPVPPMPPLPVTPTPMPTPEPEPTPLDAYYLPLINWNVQGGGFLPLRTASPAQAGNLWIPYAAKDAIQNSFNLPELEAAQRAIGYDPAIWAEHTSCTLAPGTDPAIELRFAFCEQPARLTPEGEEDWSTYVLYEVDPADGIVKGRFVQSARTVKP
jgi:hypothetical protein